MPVEQKIFSNNNRKIRIAFAVSILVITPLGFLTKAYQGPLAYWVNNSLGGLLYVTFWCLVWGLVNPQWSERNIAIAVLVVTSLLEFAQLWHPPVLNWLRSFYLGQVVLGTTFVWSDFFYYVVGAGLGWWWLKQIKTKIPVSA